MGEIGDSYDLIVVGAGAAGLAAARAARRHRRVALIEAQRPGGECTFTGCVPSKTLLEIARRAASGAEGGGVGLSISVQVDIPKVLDHVRAVVEEIALDESPERLRSEGIELVHGQGWFVDQHSIEVDGRVLTSKRFVIAVGSRPALLPVPGLAEAGPLTNESIFELREAPEHLLVLGGGAVGCELSQAFMRLGVPVTLVEAEPRILGSEEPEASAVVASALRSEGVDLHEGVDVSKARRGSLMLKDGRQLVGTHVLVAAGRTPDIEHLRLERAGVALEPDGSIRVDERNRTTRSHIYAVGDCASSLRFTHVADEQGRTVIGDLSSRLGKRTDLGVIPWAIFTEPEVGRVGMTEAEAFARFGDKARVAMMPIDETDRGRISGRKEGFIKLIGAPHAVTRMFGGGRLVGMTVVCERGGELVAEGALAMRSGAFAGRLAQTVHAYPTWSLAVRQAAAQWFIGSDRSARPPG